MYCFLRARKNWLCFVKSLARLMAVAAIQKLNDVDVSGVVLDEAAIKGLSQDEQGLLKARVVLANEAWDTAGNSIRACAVVLCEIQANAKSKGNWTALLDSGDLHFSKSIAQDLVAANKWLSEHQVPDRFLTNVSARTLGTIARVSDKGLQQRLVQKIVEVEGTGLSEAEVKKMLRDSKPKKVLQESKKASAGLKQDASKDEVVKYYTGIVNSLESRLNTAASKVIKLEKVNAELKEQLAKSKTPSSVKTEARDGRHSAGSATKQSGDLAASTQESGSSLVETF